MSWSKVWSINDVVDEALDNGTQARFGSINMKQNVTNCANGTTSININVDFGEKPKYIRAAYVIAPATPAAPVPDDHADITFL